MFKYAYRLYRLLKMTKKIVCFAVNCVVTKKKCVGYITNNPNNCPLRNLWIPNKLFIYVLLKTACNII